MYGFKDYILNNVIEINNVHSSLPNLHISPSKVLGYVDFNKQSPRNSFEKLQLTSNAHEKRFENYDQFPKISTKSARNPVEDFSKTKSRDFKNMKVNLTPSLYNPNYEYLKRSLSKTGVDFKKALPRPPIISPKKVKEMNAHSNDYVL